MSYQYANGILKSLENKVLGREKIIKLNHQNILSSLKDSGYGDQQALSVESIVASEMMKVKATIEEISPIPSQTANLFIEYDALNTKLVWKNIKFDVPLILEKTTTGRFDLALLKEIANNEVLVNDSLFSSVLTDTRLDASQKQLFKKLRMLINEEITSLELSSEIDKMFFQYGFMNVKGNAILKKYFQNKIDCTNLILYLRAKALNWDYHRFMKMFIDCGNISCELYHKGYNEALSDATINTLYQANLLDTNSFRKGLSNCLKQFITDQNYNRLEKNLFQVQIDDIAIYKNDSDNIGPLLYYFLTKSAEAKNIKTWARLEQIELNDLLYY